MNGADVHFEIYERGVLSIGKPAINIRWRTDEKHALWYIWHQQYILYHHLSDTLDIR